MGGTIQLVVRKKDGEITSFPVWTNSMSIKLLKNPEFLAGDFTAFDEFVNYHHELMNDYDKNRLTKHFKDSGAVEYGSHSFGGLYPMSYGIIIFDFKSMKIFEMQEYTCSKSIYAAFENTKFQTDIRIVSLGSGADLVNVNHLLNGGHIQSIRTDYSSDVDYDISHVRSLEELNSFLNEKLVNSRSIRKNHYGNKESFSLDLIFDKKGFETIIYEVRQKESVEKFLMDIQSVGFTLSANDQEQWKSYIRTYED